MVIQVGSAGEIYGAGGDGGTVSGNPSPLSTIHGGENGTSAIGIGYTCRVVNNGYIQCGFGGGGTGSWQTWGNNPTNRSCGGGGGGGAGCRTPRVISGNTLYVSVGGTITNFTPTGNGTRGASGQNGQFRIGGNGGAGGNAAGAGGTGGYSSNSITGWAIKYGKFTNKVALRPTTGTPTTGISTVDNTPTGVFFHPEGLYFYVIGQQSDSISRYTCVESPWQVHTAKYDGPTKVKSVTTENTQPTGMYIRPDGTRMWMCGTGNNRIYQYDMSTAWDVSTATVGGFYTVSTAFMTTGTIQDIWWKPDGSSFYLAGVNNGNDSIAQVNASSSWNVTTGISTGGIFNMNNIDNDIASLSFKTDGKKMYVLGKQFDSVYEFDLNTAWTVNQTNITPANSTASRNLNRLFVGFSNVFGQGVPDGDETPEGIFIRQDNGETLYMVGNNRNDLFQYSLTAQSGEGGKISDVYGGLSGYPGYAFVVGAGATLLPIEGTGTLIGLTTTGTIN